MTTASLFVGVSVKSGCRVEPPKMNEPLEEKAV